MKPVRVATAWPIRTPVAAEFPDLQFYHDPQLKSKGFAAALRNLRFYFGERKADVVFANDLRVPLALSVLNRIFFWRPVLIYAGDSVFLYPPSRGPVRLFQEVKAAILRRGVHHFIVLSTDEARAYARVWGFPPERVTAIKFKVIGEDKLDALPVADEPYIWTGGDSERDYPAFFAAMRLLPRLNARVYTNLRIDRKVVPLNVDICPNDGSVAAFYGPAARARVCVMPLRGNVLRSAGQGTYLSAMYLKKALVVSDTPGVRDHVCDTVSGLIVPPGSPERMAAAIAFLWHDAPLRRILGETAGIVARLENRHGDYMRRHFQKLRWLAASAQ